MQLSFQFDGFFRREFDGLVQEINAPPTPREVVLKLNFLPGDRGRYGCKKHDREGQLGVCVTCDAVRLEGHLRTTIRDAGAVPKFRQEECSGALPPVCREACSEVAHSLLVSATRNKSRPCSLGRTGICLCAALKSKLAPTKDERVSSGRKAKRTSEAIGRLMRSGIAHLGFTPHTVLSKTSLQHAQR